MKTYYNTGSFLTAQYRLRRKEFKEAHPVIFAVREWLGNVLEDCGSKVCSIGYKIQPCKR